MPKIPHKRRGGKKEGEEGRGQGYSIYTNKSGGKGEGMPPL